VCPGRDRARELCPPSYSIEPLAEYLYRVEHLKAAGEGSPPRHPEYHYLLSLNPTERIASRRETLSEIAKIRAELRHRE
jgi:hypothetical protein